MNLLRMRDFVTFNLKATENKKRLHECRDSVEESGHKLLVTLEASHSGLVNGNLRWYRPDRMRDGIPTWLSKGREIQKPMLVHHDQKGDCLGRVMTAKYVDTSALWLPEFNDFSSNYFCDAKPGKKLDVFQSIDWIVDNLQTRSDYEGLGYTELGVKITSPEAIRKIQDGEYKSVSIGFGTDSGICSICHTDWAKDDRCEHKMGRTYKDRLAFLIAGHFRNKEVSFVNFGADPVAQVKGHQLLAAMKDSLETRIFFMGLPRARQTELLECSDSQEPAYADELLISDIELVSEAEMDDPQMNLDELLEKAKQATTKDEVVSLRDQLAGVGDPDAGAKRKIKRALVNLDSLIRKNNWNDSVLTKEQVEARIAGLDAMLPTLSAEARDEYVRTLETDAKAFGLPFTAAVATPDASAKADAVDSAASTDAEGTSTGSGVTPEKTIGGITSQVTAELKFKDSAEGKKFVEALEALEAAAASIPEGEVWASSDALYTLWEKLNKTRALEWAKQRLSKSEDSEDVIVLRKEWDGLHDELSGVDADLKKLESDNTVLTRTNRTLIQDQKVHAARMVIMGRAFAGDKRLLGMDSAAIEEEITKLAGRHLASLNDSVNDLFESLPEQFRSTRHTGGGGGAPVAQSDSPAAETAKEIKDSASLEAKDQPGEIAATDNQKSGDEPVGTEGRPCHIPAHARDLRLVAMRKHARKNSKTE